MDIVNLGLDKRNWVATNLATCQRHQLQARHRGVRRAGVDLVELGVAHVVQAHECIDLLELRIELDKSTGAGGL